MMMAAAEERKELPQGKVEQVKTQWMVYEDGALAHNLQEGDWEEKYDWNRKSSKIVRVDRGVAKVVTSEEEEQRQRARMLLMEENKRRADEDALLAKQIQDEMLRDDKKLLQEIADLKLAARLQEQEKKQAIEARSPSSDHAPPFPAPTPPRQEADVAPIRGGGFARSRSIVDTDRELALKLQAEEAAAAGIQQRVVHQPSPAAAGEQTPIFTPQQVATIPTSYFAVQPEPNTPQHPPPPPPGGDEGPPPPGGDKVPPPLPGGHPTFLTRSKSVVDQDAEFAARLQYEERKKALEEHNKAVSKQKKSFFSRSKSKSTKK